MSFVRILLCPSSSLYFPLFLDAFAKLGAVPGVTGGPNASTAANLAALQQLAAVASGRGTNANPQAQQAATVALQLLLHQPDQLCLLGLLPPCTEKFDRPVRKQKSH